MVFEKPTSVAIYKRDIYTLVTNLEGVNIRDSKFGDERVPTKTTKIGTPRK